MLVCRPADPEAKGLIERAHDYLERSFLPGRAFAGPAEFNAQLTDWLAVVNPGPAARWAGGGERAACRLGQSPT
ncbi:hypothetical protein GCM10023320_50000 [Pseudonocardia adelaidensis]|uniref:Integrase catalytic domain-containing protein n=1 Tax=Pseudonocardia adelaidensis TaxID=648754 RepID=A0ABP9NSF4_9PSEU